MDFNGSYPLVKEILDEAEDEFYDNYSLDEDRCGDLEEICGIIDELVKEFDCSFVEASFDDVTMSIVISFVCDEMTMYHGRKHKFFTLVNLVDSFKFSKAKPDGLRVDFFVRVMTRDW